MSSSSSTLSASDLFNVQGLVALVTGGGTGIGLMITKALAHNGATKVYIAGRRREVLEKAAASVGPNVVPVTCDVTSTEDLRRAAEFVKQDAGFLNLLVCNSGISGPQVPAAGPDASLEDWAAANLAVEQAAFADTFAVNTAAPWYTAMAFLTLLDAGNKKGNLAQTSQVIVTSSVAGYNKVSTGGYAYGQSKAAATMLVKQLSVALPQWGIR